MGNINVVTDADGNRVGELDLGLRCFLIVSLIADKYVPNHHIMSAAMAGKIDEFLEPIYGQCTPAENIMLLIFINEESDFTEDDLPAFDEAISQWPEDWPGSPLHIIKTVRKWLVKYKALHHSYKGVAETDGNLIDKEDVPKLI